MDTAMRASATQNAKEIDRLEGDVKLLKKAVFGNGDPGMDEQIRYLVRLADERKKREEFFYYTTVGTALSAVVMLIVNGVLYFTRIQPLLDKIAGGG